MYYEQIDGLFAKEMAEKIIQAYYQDLLESDLNTCYTRDLHEEEMDTAKICASRAIDLVLRAVEESMIYKETKRQYWKDVKHYIEKYDTTAKST